jgi:hypothetical protein
LKQVNVSFVFFIILSFVPVRVCHTMTNIIMHTLLNPLLHLFYVCTDDSKLPKYVHRSYVYKLRVCVLLNVIKSQLCDRLFN